MIVLALSTLSSSIAPTGSDVVVSDSSFFRRYPSLPSFEEVRRQASLKPSPKESIEVFGDLNLLAKFASKNQLQKASAYILFGAPWDHLCLYRRYTHGVKRAKRL